MGSPLCVTINTVLRRNKAKCRVILLRSVRQISPNKQKEIWGTPCVSRLTLYYNVTRRNVGLFHFVLLGKSVRTNRQKYGVPPCVSQNNTLLQRNKEKSRVILIRFVGQFSRNTQTEIRGTPLCVTIHTLLQRNKAKCRVILLRSVGQISPNKQTEI